MKILVIPSYIPMPDRASGDLRFYTLLKLIAESHHVTLCPLHLDNQTKEIGLVSIKNYIKKLEDINIKLQTTDILTTIRTQQFDLVVFEFYYCARSLYIDYLRIYQPKARLLIDSVDIHYKRFFSKASVTGDASDIEYAEAAKQQEIATYQKADLIIVVSEDDGLLLKKDAPDIKIGILSNIHRIPEFILPQPPFNKLLFVGSFKHEPNIDAVLYFCHEIYPLLLEMNPDFTLEVIGPDAPESIRSLHSEKIFIRGFIENLDECYRNTHISIAPLRFGAGIKGKIGEALSFGLPVVTTEIGAEGFGLTPGENILIAQTSLAFAKSIFQLSQDYQLYKKLSNNGYKFIKDNYSEDATKKILSKLIDQALLISPKKFTIKARIIFWLLFPYNNYSYYIKPWLQLTYNTYIGWRFQHEWNS